MQRSLIGFASALVVFASGLLALEIKAPVKNVDAEKGVLVFAAQQNDPALRLTNGAADEDWEKLPDGSTGKETSYRGVGDIVLPAYIRKPKGPGPFPVVVMLHGGKYSKGATLGLGRSSKPPVQDFINAGWAVYAIDYRPQEKIVIDPTENDDCVAAVKAVRQFPFIDSRRVGLHGASHGANLTSRLISRAEVSGAVLCAPAALDLIEVKKAFNRGEKLVPILNKLVGDMETKYGAKAEEFEKHPKKYGYSSAMTEVDQVKCPLLIINGKNDDNSPTSIIDIYVKKLNDAGKSVDTYLPENGPHGFYYGRPDIPEWQEATRRAVAFFKKCFKEKDGTKEPAGQAIQKEKPADPQPKPRTKYQYGSMEWVDPDKTETEVLKYKTFRSQTIKADVSYMVYLPPDYDKATATRYPVLYHLHASGGTPKRDGADITTRFDKAIRSGRIDPMIIICPNGLRGATMYSDTRDGDYPVETVIVKDLVPHVDATYRTVAAREGRALDGFSMGGFGAAHFGFKFPEVFGVVSVQAPPLLGPELTQALPMQAWSKLFPTAMGGDLGYWSTNDPFALVPKNADALRDRSVIRIVAHVEDENWLAPQCEKLHQLLIKHGIAHHFLFLANVKSHNRAQVLDTLGDAGLGFFSAGFDYLQKSANKTIRTSEAQSGPTQSGKRTPEELRKQREAFEKANPPRDSTGLIPLTDLGNKTYKEEQGGLYPGGENVPSAAHLTAGLEIARQILPLDKEGRPSDDGKIVLLSIGMSNTTMEFQVFQKRAAADPELHPRLVIVDGAQGGQPADVSANPRTNFWKVVDRRLSAAGVTPKQVRVIWIKHAYPGPSRPFPEEAKKLQGHLVDNLHTARDRFPNLKIAYLSSRTYGGYSRVGGNPEPHAYESGFAVKWLLAHQIAGKPELNYDPAKGAVRSPWLAWGPYLWADGVKGRKDGLAYLRQDFTEEDGMHPSMAGRDKVAKQLLDFLKNEPSARPWFVATPTSSSGQARVDPPQKYASAVQKLEQFISLQVAEKNIPALSIALVDDQTIVWSRGFGSANPKTKISASAETLYRVGSVSKLFTDLAVMQLVEQGQLDLDAPITQYLPDFKPGNPFSKPITLRHLMAHRSGLVREPPIGNYFDSSNPSLAQMVRSLNQTELVYEPGTKTKYSNAAIGVVGYVLEITQKEAFVAYLQRKLVNPMGMTRSGFGPITELKKNLAVATMWTYHGREFEAPTFELGMAPAGCMYSTATDLARFLNVLFGGGRGPQGLILKPATLELMFKPQFVKSGEDDPDYGIGFRLKNFHGRRRIGHGGAIYGFATELAALPAEKLGVVVIASRDCVNAVTTRIADVALQEMLIARGELKETVIEETRPIDPETARKWAGHYRHEDTDIALIERAGKLWMLPHPDGLKVEVRALPGAFVVDDRLSFGTKIALQGDDLRIGQILFKRVAPIKPALIPAKWLGLIGEYGWDHNILYILERHGKLHVLIEWFFLYPLEEVSENVFQFPNFGLYQGEKLLFKRDETGRASAVEAAEVVFPRRQVDGENGATFRIRSMRPLDELRREALAAKPPPERGEFANPDLVEVTSMDPTVKLDIRYATTNNFLSTPFYSSAKAFLQRPAAEALVRVHKKLASQGFGLLIHDGYRPWYVSKMFWEATPPKHRIFVADPEQGSRHNRGCAVDLTLYDLKTGKPVEMVGGYDEFSDRSFPDYLGGTSRERWHRDLLRRSMEEEDFTVFEAEWWHFDYKDWKKYAILNWTFEQLNKK